MSRRIVAVLAAAALGLSAPIANASQSEWESSVPESFGINDPSCVPSGQIVEPVVLLHGTYNNAGVWKSLIPMLKDQGACVWAFDYGADDVSLQNASPSTKAISDLDDAAEEIARHVDYVRAVTGAEKVDLVGHSQGGTHIKTYTQMYGGAEHVARAVALGGNFHGTTLGGQGEGLANFIAFHPASPPSWPARPASNRWWVRNLCKGSVRCRTPRRACSTPPSTRRRIRR